MRYQYFETLNNKDGEDPLFSIQDNETEEIIGFADERHYAQFICDALNNLDQALKKQGLS